MSLIIAIIVIDLGIYFYLSDNSQKSHYKTDLFDNSKTTSLNGVIVLFRDKSGQQSSNKPNIVSANGDKSEKVKVNNDEVKNIKNRQQFASRPVENNTDESCSIVLVLQKTCFVTTKRV